MQTLEQDRTGYLKALAGSVVLLRHRLGIDMTELARRLGVSYQTVWKIEQGDRWPGPRLMLGLRAAGLDLNKVADHTLMDLRRKPRRHGADEAQLSRSST